MQRISLDNKNVMIQPVYINETYNDVGIFYYIIIKFVIFLYFLLGNIALFILGIFKKKTKMSNNLILTKILMFYCLNQDCFNIDYVKKCCSFFLSKLESNSIVSEITIDKTVIYSVLVPVTKINNTYKILYIHGNSCLTSDWKGYQGFCSKLSKELNGIEVFFPEYRFLEKNLFEDAISDVIKTYNLMLKMHPNTPIICVADSVGSVILLNFLLKTFYTDETNIKACVLISPYIDITNFLHNSDTDDFITKSYVENTYRCIHEKKGNVSYVMEEDFKNLPPIFISSSSNETTADELNIFINKCTNSFVKIDQRLYRNSINSVSFFYRLGLPESDKAIRDIVEYINDKVDYF